MASYYVGEIRMFGGYKCPDGWHYCDGSTLLISQYNVLFTILGTTYGGDGVSTFGLPNLQAASPVGIGQLTGGQNYTLGLKGGAAVVSIEESSMPAHNHNINVSSTAATTGTPTTDNYLAQTNGNNNTKAGLAYPNVNLYSTLPASVKTPNAVLNGNTISFEGGGSAHENLMPYMTTNYIIALNGTFPVPPSEG